ncbi:hypothetical protein [Xanthobacter sp. KR7-225]|uniref:hypothetical protein n=1 Tax=Xanthobacter sp. KR7-225 TaxID=3156613 RepID=UPI0032B4F028
MSKEHQFDVPPEAFEPKAWYVTRTDANAVLDEIRAWVAEGNEPHLWRGHTHSPPPPLAMPVYIGEVYLPAARVKAKRWAACPCCCPRDPKYGREPGKVAWFPDEQVIRLMGPDCFRALNPEGHDIAVANLAKEQKEWRDKVFLLGNLTKVVDAVALLEDARLIADDFDELQDTLHSRLSICAPKIWHHIGKGVLSLHRSEKEVYRRRDGELHLRPVEVTVRYGSVSVALFDPDSRPLSRKFTKVIESLYDIDYDDVEAALSALSDAERAKAAKTLDQCFQKGRELLAELAERRRCLSPANLATLRAWGREAETPIRFFINRDGSDLFVGARPSEVMRIPLPASVDVVISELPALTGLSSQLGASVGTTRKSA